MEFIGLRGVKLEVWIEMCVYIYIYVKKFIKLTCVSLESNLLTINSKIN